LDDSTNNLTIFNITGYLTNLNIARSKIDGRAEYRFLVNMVCKYREEKNTLQAFDPDQMLQQISISVLGIIN
jgi:hypothetical protein